VIAAYAATTSPHLPEGAQLLRGGPRRLLPRRDQGPSLHHARAGAAAALGADGDAVHHRGDGALAGADPVRSPRRRSGATCRPAAESVFFSTWAELPAGEVAATTVDWNTVLATRTAVLRELERLRVAGEIGAPLDADVNLYAVPAVRASLAPLGDELRFVLITSGAQVHARRAAPSRPCRPTCRGDGPVDPRAAHGRGQVHPLLAQAGGRRLGPCTPELCARCVVNLDGAGETGGSPDMNTEDQSAPVADAAASSTSAPTRPPGSGCRWS